MVQVWTPHLTLSDISCHHLSRVFERLLSRFSSANRLVGEREDICRDLTGGYFDEYFSGLSKKLLPLHDFQKILCGDSREILDIL